MKKLMSFVLLLSLGLVLIMSGCTSAMPTSFAEMDKSNDFEKVIVQTDEMCTFEVDIANFETDTIVYEGENGKILLIGVEETSSNVMELRFKAQGVVSEAHSTLMTACAASYEDYGFMQSPVTLEPSENTVVIYSLMTSEFEEFGNYFSLKILFKNCDVKERGIIKVTLQDLVLVEFNK